MVFDGTTRSSCPSGDDDSYREYRQAASMNDPLYNTEAFNRICFNICPDPVTSPSYVKNGVCYPCSELSQDDDTYEMYSEMCSNINNDTTPDTSPGPVVNIPDWFTTQQDANIREDNLNNINWNSNRARNYWKNANLSEPISDDEIMSRLNIRNPSELGYNDMNELRVAINTDRGSLVQCEGNLPEGDSPWTTMDDCVLRDGIRYFGPNQIIYEELRDFNLDRYIADLSSSEGTNRALQSFGDLLSSIQGDSAFENCVNEKLNSMGDYLTESGDDDFQVQSRIRSYETISQFTNEDINYLKRKLRKIISLRTDDVQQCMNLLNLGQSVCTTGVADKTLQIGSLIFSIVGNDRINILTTDNDERLMLNRMIDELGPLIPQAIKKIIKVSKEYETRICNVPSNTTLLLERIYTDLYDKPTHISLDFSPYLDFNSLININDPYKFIKTIVVVVVFSYLFMQFTNLAIAFLNRGQVMKPT